MAPIRFQLNGETVEVDDLAGTTTLLRLLRDRRHETGTKEGCAEGDCGACSVAVLEADLEGRATWRAVNSCLLFLPSLHGKTVVTVEGLRDRSVAGEAGYHPVQAAMVASRGSQCGYCTPGIVMSLFEACYRSDIAEPWQVDDQLCGNLCRCTGYRPIREAGRAVAGRRPEDRFCEALKARSVAGAQPLAEPLVRAGTTWVQPGTLEGLWAARQAHPGAQLVAGATDLALLVTKRFQTLPAVISLEAIPGLSGVDEVDGGWRIGATTTLTNLHDRLGAELPALDKLLRVFASRQIRNVATLGGNVCTASPIGDLPPLLLALGASAVLAGPRGERSVPFSEFFLSYRKTAMAEDEILAAVQIPRPPEGEFVQSFKVSKRRELDISIVSMVAAVRLEAGLVAQVRLAFGGVNAVPIRALAVEQALIGGPWTEEAVEQALVHLGEAVKPISDHRGSADYRRMVARNLVRAFFLESMGGDPVVDPWPVGPHGDSPREGA